MSKILEFLKWQNEISPFLTKKELLNITFKKAEIRTVFQKEVLPQTEPEISSSKKNPSLDSFLKNEENSLEKTDFLKIQNLEELALKVFSCNNCSLSKTKNKYVFGEGNENADIMFIGEGPGHDEDVSGKPFVGKAGQLLTKIIENGLKIPRNSVYIANIVKCRPPGNRNPFPNEANACLPFLKRQIELVSPKAIVLLGKVPTKFLLGIEDYLKNSRQKEYDYNGIKVFVTYHPSALLRNPSLKKPVWEDMKKLIKYLNLYSL